MKAKVNDRFFYDLDFSKESKNKTKALEVLGREDNLYRIRIGNRSYKLELVRYDPRLKRAKLAIEGFLYTVNLEEALDDILRLIEQKSVQDSGNKDVLAPIPGLIKKIVKKEGEAIEKGAPLLILEAMKMENTIQAPADAKQLQYYVAEGDHVVKGQKLLTLRMEK